MPPRPSRWSSPRRTWWASPTWTASNVSPALAALAALAGHRPDLLQRARRSLAERTDADELLATAALWAAFTGD